jgi:hypothetical protein
MGDSLSSLEPKEEPREDSLFIGDVSSDPREVPREDSLFIGDVSSDPREVPREEPREDSLFIGDVSSEPREDPKEDSLFIGIGDVSSDPKEDSLTVGEEVEEEGNNWSDPFSGEAEKVSFVEFSIPAASAIAAPPYIIGKRRRLR